MIPDVTGELNNELHSQGPPHVRTVETPLEVPAEQFVHVVAGG
jgi:hypothetical protein